MSATMQALIDARSPPACREALHEQSVPMLAMTPDTMILERLGTKRADLQNFEMELETLQERAAAIERRVLELRVEVSAFEEMLSLLGSAEMLPPPAPNLVRDGRLGPKGAWRIIMPEMLRLFPTEIFGSRDVMATGASVNVSVKPDTTRAHLASYALQGLLERVAPGRFRFTAKGRREFASLKAQMPSRR